MRSRIGRRLGSAADGEAHAAFVVRRIEDHVVERLGCVRLEEDLGAPGLQHLVMGLRLRSDLDLERVALALGGFTGLGITLATMFGAAVLVHVPVRLPIPPAMRAPAPQEAAS